MIDCKHTPIWVRYFFNPQFHPDPPPKTDSAIVEEAFDRIQDEIWKLTAKQQEMLMERMRQRFFNGK